MGGMSTAAVYTEFAAREAHRSSPAYERLSVAVSRDDEVLALLDTLPPAKRQPNLLFAVVRFLGGPVDDPDAFRAFVVARWTAIAPQILARATQTNVLSLDDHPLAWTSPHGQAMTWFARP
jgi:hypothetical protein